MAGALLVLGLQCAHAQKGPASVSDGQLELRLERDGSSGTDPLQVRARLVNRGRDALRVLHDSNVQPSTITLIDGAGRRVDPLDERSMRRIDMSVSEAMFTTIEPGGDAVILSSRFDQESGSYKLRWGPYVFEGLPSGAWTVRAGFQSAIDTVTVDGRSLPAKGRMWKGTLISEELRLVLP
jgi:hypothetical protein